MSENHLLKAENITKTFSGVHALDSVNFELKKGEIHCLAGENGCGKSTLIKVISGVYHPDGGSLIVNGKRYSSMTAIESIREGIQVIYQDFSVFPNLTVAENIAFNQNLAEGKKMVSWSDVKRIARTALERIQVKIDLNAVVGGLSVADKQLIAISRALLNDARVIIMDEPTSALTQREVESMFGVIRGLQREGLSILFVSHKLDEVFEISDSITILRNGKNVSSGPASEFDKGKLVYYMTGREIGEEKFQAGVVSEQPVLEAEGLTLKGAFRDVSFSLHGGEILGITGLLGSGRTELALSLAGYYEPTGGTLRMRGVPVHLKKIKDAMKNGIAYVPEDRLTEGLFLEQSIGKNIVVSTLEKYATKAGVLKKPKLKEAVDGWVKKLSIKTANANNPVKTLSGGNQQRVVLAKWLAMDPQILILNGPTAGVDVGSKSDIHRLMRELAKTGVAIILISDDIPEVLNNSNRLLIMENGAITGEYDCEELTEMELSERFKTSREVVS